MFEEMDVSEFPGVLQARVLLLKVLQSAPQYRDLRRLREAESIRMIHSYGCGSNKWYQNGTLVNGSKDENPRDPSSLLPIFHSLPVASFLFSGVRGVWTHLGMSPKLGLEHQEG